MRRVWEELKGSGRLSSVSWRDCHDTLYPGGGGNTVVVARAAGRAARSVDGFMVATTGNGFGVRTFS